MVRSLFERPSRVVAYGDAGQAGHGRARLALRRKCFPDLRRVLRHDVTSCGAEDEAVADPDGSLHALRPRRTYPDRRRRFLEGRRAEDAVGAVGFPGATPD